MEGRPHLPTTHVCRVRWVPGQPDIDEERADTRDAGDIGVQDARHRIMGPASIVSLRLAMVVVASVIVAVANRATPVGAVVFEAVSAGSGVGSSRGATEHLANATTKITLIVVLVARPFISGRSR